MPEHKTCLIRGKETHYWIYNPAAAKTIVVIHGLRGTHHGLAFIAAELPNYRLIIPDLPGHDASEALDETHSIDHFARWAAAFITQLKLAPGFVVLGHSFGTIIVSRLAKMHPELVAKLILINPIAAQPHPVTNFIATHYYNIANVLPEPLGIRLLRTRLLINVMTRTMLTTTQKDLKKRVSEQHFAHFSSFANRRSAVEAFRASLSDSVTHYAAHLTMPVLIIAGAKDTIVPLKATKELYQRLPYATLTVIPQVGHLIHYETPEPAARAIAAFVG